MKLKPLHNKITVRLTEGRGAWRNFLSNAEGEDTDPYCCGVVETVGFAMGAKIINDDGLALVQTVPIVVKPGDHVLFRMYGCERICFDSGEVFYVVTQGNIYAVIEEE